MIILLRGHLRESFNNSQLYELIGAFTKIDPNVSIYIHTWNVYSNNVSWRTISANNNLVGDQTIYDYFKEFKPLIKHIIIDDDNNILLNGNIEGNISAGPMPVIGWKRYLYGVWKIADYMLTHDVNGDDVIVNMRFDVLSNSNNFRIYEIVDFVKKNSHSNITKNIFIRDTECCGIDNIYIGNMHTIHTLSRHFHYNLDKIITQHHPIVSQELMIFRENTRLFFLAEFKESAGEAMQSAITPQTGGASVINESAGEAMQSVITPQTGGASAINYVFLKNPGASVSGNVRDRRVESFFLKRVRELRSR